MGVLAFPGPCGKAAVWKMGMRGLKSLGNDPSPPNQAERMGGKCPFSPFPLSLFSFISRDSQFPHECFSWSLKSFFSPQTKAEDRG